MKQLFKLLSLIMIGMILLAGAVTASAQDDKDDDPGLTIVPPPATPRPPDQRDPNDPPRDPNNPPPQGDSNPPPDNQTPPVQEDDFSANPDTSDVDGDGTPDDQDVCPTVAGLIENNGCPGDPFVPPVLPTMECFATPAGNYQVWVRPQSNDTNPAIGHLNPGVVYLGIGFVIAPDGTLWLAMQNYQDSTGGVGYAADWAILTSNCPVLGPIGTIEDVFTSNPDTDGTAGPVTSSHTLVVTSDILFGDCNDNGIDDMAEEILPDCIGDITTGPTDPNPVGGIIRLQIMLVVPFRDCNKNGKDDLEEFWWVECPKLTTGNNSGTQALPPDDDDDPYPPGVDQADVDAIVLSCGHENWVFVFNDEGVATGYACGTQGSAASRTPTTFVAEILGGDCNRNGIDDLDESPAPNCFDLTTSDDTRNAPVSEDDDDDPYPPGIDQTDIDLMTIDCGENGWEYVYDEDGAVTGYACNSSFEAESREPVGARLVVMPADVPPHGGVCDGGCEVLVFGSLEEIAPMVDENLLSYLCATFGDDLPSPVGAAFAKDTFCRKKPH